MNVLYEKIKVEYLRVHSSDSKGDIMNLISEIIDSLCSAKAIPFFSNFVSVKKFRIRVKPNSGKYVHVEILCFMRERSVY